MSKAWCSEEKKKVPVYAGKMVCTQCGREVKIQAGRVPKHRRGTP